MGSVQVGLNGFEVWAYVVQTAEGLRMRLALDDWQNGNHDTMQNPLGNTAFLGRCHGMTTFRNSISIMRPG